MYTICVRTFGYKVPFLLSRGVRYMRSRPVLLWESGPLGLYAWPGEIPIPTFRAFDFRYSFHVALFWKRHLKWWTEQSQQYWFLCAISYEAGQLAGTTVTLYSAATIIMMSYCPAQTLPWQGGGGGHIGEWLDSRMSVICTRWEQTNQDVAESRLPGLHVHFHCV